MIVIDASVVELLLNTPVAPQIAERVFAPAEILHAPHLVDLEVAQVLRRYAAARELDSPRGAEALEDLADLPILRYPHDIFLSRIWELRHNATAYDAAYIALAEALEAPLLTCDGAVPSRDIGPESLRFNSDKNANGCRYSSLIFRSKGQNILSRLTGWLSQIQRVLVSRFRNYENVINVRSWRKRTIGSRACAGY